MRFAACEPRPRDAREARGPTLLAGAVRAPQSLGSRAILGRPCPRLTPAQRGPRASRAFRDRCASDDSFRNDSRAPRGWRVTPAGAKPARRRSLAGLLDAEQQLVGDAERFIAEERFGVGAGGGDAVIAAH